MIAKRVLVIGGVVAALAVPTGVALAATGSPSPNPSTPSTTQPYGPRFGGGHGMMGGGYGDPQDCPYYSSAEHQTRMQERQKLQQQLQKATPTERQKLMQQWHDRMWANRTTGS